MRPGRGRTAAIAAAAAIATSSQTHKRVHTPTSAGAATGSTSNTTASSGAGNKSKQSNIRLEKGNKKDEFKKNEESNENEKVVIKTSRSSSSPSTVGTSTVTTTANSTASIKKRLGTSTSTPSPPIASSLAKRGRKQTLTPAVEHEKMHVDEDLSDYNLVTARARRTPKPNPKYAREDMVTNYAKSVKSAKSDEESEQGDFVDSADDFEIHSSDIKDEIGETDDELEDAGRNSRLVAKLRGRTSMQQRSNMEIGSSGNKRKFDESSTVAYNKRLNIEMYDASDSDVSIPSPNTSQRILKNVVKSSNLSSNRQTSLLRPLLKSMQSEMPKSKPIQILERRKESTTTPAKSSLPSGTTVKRLLPAIRRNEDDDVQIATTGTTSTVDDFETMPTFTIVNINDIINKKNDDILKLDTVKNDSAQQNRRKTTHTILTEKLETSPPRGPFPVRKSGTTLNNNTTKSYLRSPGDNANSSTPPRILNSVIGRKTRPVSPIVSPKDVKKIPISSTSSSSPSSYIQKNSKENVSSSSPTPTTVVNKASSSTNNNAGGTLTKTVTRKLPNDRVIVQRQGNKLVKKITCFETWFVISLPPPPPANTSTGQQQKTQDDKKDILDMSLVELGNRIKEVQLPDNWNYKVTLQKLSQAQLNRSDLEPYIGDINDSNISDEDKIKYQPINIMFRRINKIKNRMPYDRAVIFKNNGYFLNIDGKNVRLCNGAPKVIKSIDDISILLEIMNDITLNSDFVEQTAHTS